VIDAPVSNKVWFFMRYICVLQLRSLGIFGENRPTYTSKHLRGRKNIFQKQPQLTHGNNVLDAPASKDYFILRDTVFLHCSKIGGLKK
jgi:hypothetical protein